MVATDDSLSSTLDIYLCPVNHASRSVIIGSLQYKALMQSRAQSKEDTMLYLVATLDVSIFIPISTVAFPFGYIYNNSFSEWHQESVAPPSYYSESQDDASVQHDDHFPSTSPHPAGAPHVFCFLDVITVSQLPVNDRSDCDTAALQLLMLLFRRHRFRRTFAPCLSCLTSARCR